MSESHIGILIHKKIDLPIDLMYRFIYISFMDIQLYVSELMTAGWTQKAIAERVRCSQPTISDVANGKVGKKRPSHCLVTALEELHRQVCGGADLPPINWATGNLVKSVFREEDGHEEALYGRADYWFPEGGRGGSAGQGTV
ncbi:MAG: helix-turn-helix domain-containing protein, partial [Pandoraea pnomenusa]|nr:helix-turn-helix domain-containing protein [Pandoraea pnomenusa]